MENLQKMGLSGTLSPFVLIVTKTSRSLKSSFGGAQMPQSWPLTKRFEPDKWFGKLHTGNALVNLDPADKLLVAELIEEALKIFSLGPGYVGPATRIRSIGLLLREASVSLEKEANLEMLKTIDPGHRALQKLLLKKATLYQDDRLLPKKGKDVEIYGTIRLVAACELVRDRLGRPHFADVAELIGYIYPQGKERDADALRMKLAHLKRTNPRQYESAFQKFKKLPANRKKAIAAKVMPSAGRGAGLKHDARP